jgi:hypothetical protein
MRSARAGRPEAAAAIWSWRERGAAPAPDPAQGARRRGSLQALGAAAAASAVLLFGWQTLATGIFAFAALLLCSALVSPGGLYAGWLRLFAATGRLAGRLLGYALLVPLFYAFFLPFGLLLRRGRRDRLARRFDPDAPTYWEPRESRAPRLASGQLDRQY